ncbi:MAG: hypothetical protein GEU79_09530 [Acidimicrobiia bacterium]|nr:hypothetical protein [Acidimicrobiia bacterium]
MSRYRSWLLLLLTATLALLISPVAVQGAEPDIHDHPEHPDRSEPLQTQPEVGSVPAMSESWGCGRPGFYMPLAEEEGYLSDGYLVRGPIGALFGRTIGDVRANLVEWELPSSGGATEWVHERVKPSLDRVTRALANHARNGDVYEIRGEYSWGFAPRAIRAGGSISFHSFGTALDINADTNPYRTDGRLITDMPQWFVESFRNHGFCWGGDWESTKDTMHYSYMGPIPGGLAQIPAPYEPLTAPADFRDHVASVDPTFDGPTDGNPHVIADGSGDGAADVVRVTQTGPGTAALEIARSRANFEHCSVWYWDLKGFKPGSAADFADITASGRGDVLTLRGRNTGLVVRAHHASSNYEEVTEYRTGVTIPPGAEVKFADINRDGRDDMWVINRVDQGLRVRVFSGKGGPGVKFTQKIRDTVSPIPVGGEFDVALGDHDVDGYADLWVLTPGPNGGTRIRIAHNGALSTVAANLAVPAQFNGADSFAVEDYDGDGRLDLYRYGSDGGLDVWLGNTRLSGVTPEGWFMTPGFTCGEEPSPEGFSDTGDSVFYEDIEWLAREGITLGCNPPENSLFCPDAAVTRGQMAAFLVRALHLPSTAENRFVDDEGSVFEEDINRLAAVGITLGCNPPANDLFCVDNPVTRGQMASFLVRAYELTESAPEDMFRDDNGLVYEDDIERLATGAVTYGCNPPANDLFCPMDPVTRGQMAAFLHRATELP